MFGCSWSLDGCDKFCRAIISLVLDRRDLKGSRAVKGKQSVAGVESRAVNQEPNGAIPSVAGDSRAHTGHREYSAKPSQSGEAREESSKGRQKLDSSFMAVAVNSVPCSTTIDRRSRNSSSVSSNSSKTVQHYTATAAGFQTREILRPIGIAPSPLQLWLWT